KPGEWDCETCLVRNTAESKTCPACQTPKPGATQTSHLTGFKPKPGEWDCETCLVHNAANSAICPACQTPKPSAEQTTQP
ncbi:predicted protein, partial [Nematostella vectensis]